jgi:hypothetical protein
MAFAACLGVTVATADHLHAAYGYVIAVITGMLVGGVCALLLRKLMFIAARAEPGSKVPTPIYTAVVLCGCAAFVVAAAVTSGWIASLLLRKPRATLWFW